ncbi:hypothetical protein SCUCBS95973_006197 [Sporothrix curviconia]|uniref:Acyltransferase 3 domain-containing protein n=1 Tax=Sporothrix curviconia TaxID=1260050 RepID=A0ABP0C5B7_9PEZI
MSGIGSSNAPPAGSADNMHTSSDSPLATVSAIYNHAHRFVVRYQLVIGILSFVASLWILSLPEAVRGAVGTPGFITMVQMVPKHHKDSGKVDYFWVPIGAALAVLTVDRTPLLQRLFTNRFAQYMGKISYSLYLVHGSIIFSVGH